LPPPIAYHRHRSIFRMVVWLLVPRQE
jgi:hypothetical protein